MISTAHFTNGRVALQEIDTSGTGMIDTKIFYEGGQPVRAERDMANRSTAAEWRPDRWEYYTDGRTVRAVEGREELPGDLLVGCGGEDP